MKILDISHISSGVGMPLKSGSIQFIQDASREALAGLFTSLVPNPIANTLYVLSGVRDTDPSSTNMVITPGYIYLNGEIFQYDGGTLSTVGVNVYASIVTTQFTGINADPVNFSDGSQDSVHNIRKIVFVASSTAPNTIVGNPQFNSILYIDDCRDLIGDTKEIVCDLTYVANNFGSDGKAFLTSERRGWALMDGQGGRPDDRGRVVIGYDSANYPVLESHGGFKDQIILNHQHSVDVGNVSDGYTGTGSDDLGPKTASPGSGIGHTLNGVTSNPSGGVDGANRNMQPYVIRIRIMKISYNV